MVMTGMMINPIDSKPQQDPASREKTSLRTADARVELLEHVLSSRTFTKSTKLAQFLRYICTQAINGNLREINEQQIGIHVFSRSPMYSASDDSIVRTQARLLRQRLEEYFDHEAPFSPLIITIPKGGYVPVFEPRTPLPEAQAAQANPAGAASSPTAAGIAAASDLAPHSRVLRVAVVVAALFLAVVSSSLWFAHRRTDSPTDALWARIFGEGRPVIIVPSDDALVLFEEETKMPISLEQYLSGSYVNPAGPAKLGPFPLTSAWFMDHQYTSTADLQLALRLGRLPAARDASVETRNARVLRIDDLRPQCHPDRRSGRKPLGQPFPESPQLRSELRLEELRRICFEQASGTRRGVDLSRQYERRDAAQLRRTGLSSRNRGPGGSPPLRGHGNGGNGVGFRLSHRIGGVHGLCAADWRNHTADALL